MALVLKDRVKETSTSTGTGDFVLAGAATGFQSFASALADGDTTYYAIEDGTDWETGLGTWTESTSTLARTTVYESSNSGSAVDWGAGTKNVFITQPASRTATIAVYPTIDDLPLTGNVQAGDQAYVSDNNRLYLYNGTGWFNIALINQTPTISGNEASYVLASDGTATVVTLTGTDAEGIPITWSATTSGDVSAASVTNVDNVFTITPSTDSNDAGTITVTFRASDGVNISTATSQFNLSFGPDWSATTQQAKIQSSDVQAADRFGDQIAIDGDTVIVSAWLEDTGGSSAGSAYIFTRSGSSWTEQQKIQASDIEASDQFGYSVSISGDTVIVGARSEDTGGSNAGAAYIFTLSGSTWTQQAKLTASDPEGADYFGAAVAIDGDTAIVGALQEDTGGSAAGAAYIFTRSGSTWTQQQKIQASDPQASDYFGNQVAIDGDTVVVGAYSEDTGGADAGAAYVFTRSGSTWTQQQKIQSSDVQATDYFGRSVSISGDTLIVGANGEDTGATDAGAAYIFTRSGSNWTQQAKLTASDPEASDSFGYSVEISGDTVIVGAFTEDTGGSDAGAAYIFTRSGSSWTEQQKIQASDPEADDHFGVSVAISGDTAIVGARFEDTGGASAGAAYIFVAG